VAGDPSADDRPGRESDRCAASFIAAIGDPNRFLTSRKLVAYLGLDPRVKQSGEAPGPQRPDLHTRLGVRPLGAR
jgi:Transposase IS116/IS110/IS902 family